MPDVRSIDASVSARMPPSECRWTRGVQAEGPYALGGTPSEDGSEQAKQEAHTMRFESEVVPEALDRLRRVNGQLGGIIRMIEQGRDCQDVVQQLAAVGRAVDRVGLKLLAGQLRQCLNDEEAARDEGYEEGKFERLFLMLT